MVKEGLDPSDPVLGGVDASGDEVGESGAAPLGPCRGVVEVRQALEGPGGGAEAARCQDRGQPGPWCASSHEHPWWHLPCHAQVTGIGTRGQLHRVWPSTAACPSAREGRSPVIEALGAQGCDEPIDSIARISAVAPEAGREVGSVSEVSPQDQGAPRRQGERPRDDAVLPAPEVSPQDVAFTVEPEEQVRGRGPFGEVERLPWVEVHGVSVGRRGDEHGPIVQQGHLGGHVTAVESTH